MNDDELAIVANLIHQGLGEGISLAIEAYGIDVEAMLRFMPLAEKCRTARARKGLSLKDAARALKVPQYRLKDIEENRVRSVDQAVLVLYIELLEIKQWFSRWKAQNRSLYESLRPIAR
ncbi:MAG TPA: helix-turn-helix domain-containing protein [Pyrinomonadaceae bacterium]